MSTLNRRRLSRRLFLGSVSSAAAALPFLRSFPLQAGGNAALPKVLFVGFPNGPLVGPNGGADYGGRRPDGFTPPEGALPATLPGIYEPLSAHRDKLVFLENLHYVELLNGHRGTNGFLTGRRRYVPPGQDLAQYTSSGISVDQYLGQELGTNVLNTAFDISGFATGESYWSYTGQAQPVTPIQNPVDAYERVFGEGLDDNLAAEVLARRTSVLDVIAGDLQSIQLRIPQEDRPRVEAHLESVRSLEQGLIATANAGCQPPGAIPGYEFLSSANAPRVFRDHAEVITQAFACGWSRIATMQMGSFGGDVRLNWPELGIDTPHHEHAVCHSFAGNFGMNNGLGQAEGIELGIAKEKAFSTLFAEVLDKLSTTLDVDGQPLLENTLVVYVRPFGVNHDAQRILWIAAGGAGVGVQGGRFLQVGDGPDNPRYYNDVLTTVCNAMGHPVETFGDPQFCQTPIELG